MSSFKAVLDWGCGAGRVTRYLSLSSSSVTGADINADNVAMCKKYLPNANFVHIAQKPLTAFADKSFGLIIRLSVFTHLGEADQLAWLNELKRITLPGGIVLMTILSESQMHLYRD